MTTAVEKTADGIRKTGKYIKSNVKNAADKSVILLKSFQMLKNSFKIYTVRLMN
ncbi:MAG: hypothetical protein KTV77_02160 [Wolbachia endosymbiont of Fragariocoptes setiger]|nr:hypothetical protein [Wolbachia endosymbiont of Fragariocoptes setiger]